MKKSSSSKGKNKVESSEINNYWEKASIAVDVDRVEAAMNERMDDIAADVDRVEAAMNERMDDIAH